MPRRTVTAPRDYLVSGAWPTGELVADVPPGVVVAHHVARALQAELDTQGISQRELARRAGVAHTTIGRFLTGETYVDVPALAAIEVTVGRRLWPADVGGDENDGDSTPRKR